MIFQSDWPQSDQENVKIDDVMLGLQIFKKARKSTYYWIKNYAYAGENLFSLWLTEMLIYDYANI